MTQQTDWHQSALVDHEQGRGDPFAAAVRSTRMPMLISDPRLDDDPIVFVNDAFLALTGYEREEVLGRNSRFLHGPKTDRETIARLRRAVAAEEAIGTEILNYRKDGTPFWSELSIGPVRGEDGAVQFYFASQIDMSEQVEAREEIVRQKARVEAEVERRTCELERTLAEKERLLAEKSILLEEIDHRVKNNLSMVGALLRLQARKVSDPVQVNALRTTLSRVSALSSIHRTLHETPDLRRFDASGFVHQLLVDIIGEAGRDQIELIERIEAVDIEASGATPFGLIVNELLTNALKHAFADGRKGRLEVTLDRQGSEVRVVIADDGPGFDPAKVDRGTLGQSLVERLSRQLGGTTRWDASGCGATSVTAFRSEPVASGAVAAKN